MSELATKASLASLPDELLIMIFPNRLRARDLPANSDHDEYCRPLQRLPKHHKSVRWETQHTFLLLTALSRTCRRLRAFALPFIWESIELGTVAELGKLVEVLRAEPRIAAYIQHFNFSWSMNNDIHTCEPYGAELGTALDMAFIDRGELWERTRQEQDDTPLRAQLYFVHDGVRFERPGVNYHSESAYRFRLACSGPDNAGEDRRIKSAKDFNDAFAEIATQLTSVRTFRWNCPVTPLPVGVFEALKIKKTLTALHFTLAVYRGNHNFVPFWQLCSKVTDLSIGQVDCEALDSTACAASGSEADIMSFELPTVPLTASSTTHASAELVLSIACRTIVAAARSSGLRRLSFDRECSEAVEARCFSVPSLLPCWINIEDWGRPITNKCDALTDSWRIAVMKLRAALAHTSHALRVHRLASNSASKGSNERHLGSRDVRSMYACFEEIGRPVLYKPRWRQDNMEAQLVWGGELKQGSPFERYLAWLRNDAALARQVAAAWNSIADRGEADTFRCFCGKCYDEGVGAEE